MRAIRNFKLEALDSITNSDCKSADGDQILMPGALALAAAAVERALTHWKTGVHIEPSSNLKSSFS